MTSPDAASVTELVLADATGVWAVRSASVTVYYLDVDALLLLRKTGPGSSQGPADDRWVPLVTVQAISGGDLGVVRVGDRHTYTYDYDPTADHYGFWIQRQVSSIDYVEGEELAGLPLAHLSEVEGGDDHEEAG